jgi:hypothetical protein
LVTFSNDVATNERSASFCALGVLCELAAESQIVFRADLLVEDVNGLYLVDEVEWYDGITDFGAYVDPSYDVEQIEDHDMWVDTPFEAGAAGFASVLPDVVRQWADLKLVTGGTSFLPAISVLNDAKRLTFDEIAAHIEEHWEEM